MLLCCCSILTKRFVAEICRAGCPQAGDIALCFSLTPPKEFSTTKKVRPTFQQPQFSLLLLLLHLRTVSVVLYFA